MAFGWPICRMAGIWQELVTIVDILNILARIPILIVCNGMVYYHMILIIQILVVSIFIIFNYLCVTVRLLRYHV